MKMVGDQSDARLVTRSLRRSRAIGLFWLVTIIVLVLSKAVLVIVIDVSMNLRAGLRGTIEFHRHSGQHRDDPIEHPFHRGIVLNFDSVGPQQHALDGGTRQADIRLVSITITTWGIQSQP